MKKQVNEALFGNAWLSCYIDGAREKTTRSLISHCTCCGFFKNDVLDIRTKGRMMKKIFILLMFVAQSAVAADKTPPSGDAYSFMTQTLATQCSTQVASILNDPDWAPLVKNRPLNVADICSCAMQGFKTDERLKQALTFDILQEPKRLESKKLKAYFVMRLVQSMFSCISTEFSQVLNENDPTK